MAKQSPSERLFRFGTLVPEVWRNTYQRQQNEKLFDEAYQEVMALKKVLVYADKLLTVCETDGFFSIEDQIAMRKEVDKAMSFTIEGFPRTHRDDQFCECDVCMGFTKKDITE